MQVLNAHILNKFPPSYVTKVEKARLGWGCGSYSSSLTSASGRIKCRYVWHATAKQYSRETHCRNEMPACKDL